MLTSLPKLADKAFIIGFFIPTLLFVLVITALFYDQGWSMRLAAAALQKDGWDQLAYFVLAVWVLSVLLMMFNLIELQILEGYRWPVSQISRLKQAEVARFTAKEAEYNALNDEWDALGDAFTPESRKQWERLRIELLQQFPTDRVDQLPTRLGNAIRAFEVYSRYVYGADSIPLWIHLSTVIPDGFQSAIDDARAQMNCAINVSVLAAIVSPIALIRCLSTVHWSALVTAQNSYHALVEGVCLVSILSLVAMIVALVICRVAYLFAIELVYAWGDLVKAAFDCYLPALADKLGYKLPETAQQRHAFWHAISEQAIYWYPMEPEKWKPAEKIAPANAEASTALEIKKLLRSIFR